MDGWAIILDEKGKASVEACATNPDGRRPGKMEDGRKVWNWSSKEDMAKRLADRVNARRA